MWKYIGKRLLQAIPLLLIISFIVFALIQIAPFDVVDTLTTPNMTQEQIDLLREKNGLNDPFWFNICIGCLMYYEETSEIL